VFNFSKVVSDPQILVAGFLLGILYKIILVHIKKRFLFQVKNRELFFLFIITLLFIPVYLQNSTFFTVSPDSQGLLRSPSGSTTYRPPLLWGIYRLFASQQEIDQFFETKPNFGAKMYYSEILVGSNFIMISYLLSLILLLWVFYRYLKIDAILLVMVVLIQSSGPLYYTSEYYFIPIQLVPIYKFLFYFLLASFFLREISKISFYKTYKKKRDFNSLLILCFGGLLLLLSSRSSLMVDEINQVMTETLTITLINFTLALCVIFFASRKIYYRYFILGILGLSTGLLMIIKLSTLVAPLIIVVFILILKIPLKEKIVASGLFLTIAICPLAGSTFLGTNSETSQTWYGLVGYAIEFQNENPIDLRLSSDSKQLLSLALSKRAETWKKFPEIVREYDFIYQKTPISLFYGALPASQELGFNSVSPSYASKLFREISISSFDAHKTLVFKALFENLKVPTGLSRQDGQFLTMSKILKNPFVYFLLIPILIRYISRRSEIDNLTVLLIFSFILMNYLVVSVFNGPIPRYFYLYDPLLLYSIIIMWSKCLSMNRENAE
jgi:hypothetical protein